MRDHALSSIPWPMRVIVGQVVYRSHKAMLYGQGTLRLSDEEVRAAKTEIWDTINGVLVSVRSSHAGSSGDTVSSKRPFWFLGGDDPTEVDTTLFGMIVSVLLATASVPPFLSLLLFHVLLSWLTMNACRGPESQSIVKGYPVVVEYAERIHAAYFPDYEKWP